MAIPRPTWTQYQEAVKRCGGDQAFLEQLLDIYIRDVAERLGVLQQALAEKNLHTIRRQAHTLKRAWPNPGLESLGKLAHAVAEIAVHKGELETVRAALERFAAEFTALLLADDASGQYGIHLSTAMENKPGLYSAGH